ncbi:MAG: YraN family protein [Ruminococcaceae bacterium]|nr:YraN family protein [Oscillospiraceae bacterium]
MNSNLKGRTGEAVAADYLRKKGYKLKGLNYKSRYGEIDIIAEIGKIIVFAEVKLRKDSSFAKAFEFVDAYKQERLKKTALIWLSDTSSEKQCRFDVIEVYFANGINEINHIEDAF